MGGSRDGGSLKPALVSRTADPSPLYFRGIIFTMVVLLIVFQKLFNVMI